MNNILKDKIILPGWNIVKDNTKLKSYYLFPGILSIIFLTFLLVYQSIYTYVEVFGKTDEALLLILDFFHSEYIIEMIIAAVIFLLIYFFTLPVFEGGLIHYIDHKNNNKDITGSEAFGMGIYKFFPIFEYNNLFSEFKFMSILNAFLFTLRFLGIDYIDILIIIFSLLLCLSVFINVLFVYSKYYIVLENEKIFSAIGKSSKLAILNFRTTFKLYLLMFILNIRVILNFLIFLFFPILISVAIIFLSQIFLLVALVILGVLFLGAIYILGYLTAVLDVFKASIWYFAYNVGKEKLKKIEDSI